MKKLFRKIALLLAVTVVFAGANISEAYAASTLVVHAKDGADWGTVNIFNWGDAGEITGAWPGTEMTAEGDGWYTYTVETDYNLNLVFSAEGGSPQTSDVNDVPSDAGEVWVVIGGEGGENAKGIAALEAVLYTTPEAGWPTIAAAEGTSSEASATAADTEAAADVPAADTDVPKTGEGAPAAAIVFIALAASTAVMSVILKKKQSGNH
jgi:hypothetical protein